MDLRIVRPAGCLLATLLCVASCGGENVNYYPPGPDPTPGRAPPAAPVPPATSTLVVEVIGLDLAPQANAEVNLYDQGTKSSASAHSGQDGRVQFTTTSGPLTLSVSHPSGSVNVGGITAPFNGARTLSLRLRAPPVLAVAMLPAHIPETSLSADRRQLDVQLQVLRFVSPGYSGEAGVTPAGVRLHDCYVGHREGSTSPLCLYPTDGTVSIQSLVLDRAGQAVPASHIHTTLLLVDQGNQASRYDPHDLRWSAGKAFIHDVLATGTPAAPRRTAVAGFAASPGTGAPWSPLLLPPPAWDVVGSASAFAAEEDTQRTTLDALRPLGGGPPATFAALHAAMDLLASHEPAGGRGLVALMDGAHEDHLDEPTRAAALAALAQQQAETGVQTVIISAGLASDAPERARLAELAGALDAPLVMAGYPTDWNDHRDGLHAAMALAGQIITGAPLPGLQLTFRLRSPPGTGFTSGAVLHGTLLVDSDICPFSCAELPLAFAARVP